MGIGSALGIVGYQLVEIWLRKRGNQFFSGKEKRGYQVKSAICFHHKKVDKVSFVSND
ncbi:hypothetical protein PROPEN_01091 [Proteus penneri ATCC 35198]|nr:hypothetical protein PROPEN_01091 [Proteus penneri ATCC 35198]